MRTRAFLLALTLVSGIQGSLAAPPAAKPAGAAKGAAVPGSTSDYFAVAQKEGVHRWAADHVPIHVDIMVTKAASKPALIPMLKECFQTWEKASEGRIAFVVKERQDLSQPPNWADNDIIIDFVDRSIYGDTHSLWGRGQVWLDEKQKGAPIDKVVIEMFTGAKAGTKALDADIKRTMLHEIGHALGLPHSPVKTDIMSVALESGAGPAAPSARDIATLKRLYDGYQPVAGRQLKAKAALEQPGASLPGAYLNDLSRKLAKAIGAQSDEDDETVCTFLITADGSVSDVRVTTPGPKVLDEAAVKAIQTAGFKPLPAKDASAEAPPARMYVKFNGEGVVEVITPDKTAATPAKDEVKAAMGAWVTKITDQVKSNWKPPTQAPLEVSVQVRVLPDGKVHEAKIVKNSGSAAVDMSAIKAAYEASPLPPYPPESGLSFAKVEVQLEQKKQ